MGFTTLRVPGADAIQTLTDLRARYAQTGQFPFLIGNVKELERLQEAEEFDNQDPAAIIEASIGISITDWMASERKNADEYDFSSEETLGDWPQAMPEKGSIGLHKDIVTRKVKPEVYLGLAKIKEPWQLPAVLKYGGWNECPDASVHCAFYRSWQERYGAEITGMCGDTVECTVARPPISRDDATSLAWEQFWYCKDIVEQGCESVANLAATLLNSPYWFFWWD